MLLYRLVRFQNLLMVSGGRMTFSHLDTNLHLCVFCAQKKVGKGDVFPIQPMKA